MVKKEYYSNGNKKIEIWYKNKKKHRLDGPAEIFYYENGNKKMSRWYNNDKSYRMIYYYDNEDIKEEYWYKEGRLHKKNGPAVIWYYPNGNKQEEHWYNYNKCYKTLNYYKNGNKRIEYWYNQNGQFHRDDGPAVIHYNKDKIIIDEKYYLYGKLVDELVILINKV